MKTTTKAKLEKQIQDGKIECVTDIKIGYVEVRNTTTGKRETIQVTQ